MMKKGFWIWTLALPLISYVALGMSFDFVSLDFHINIATDHFELG